jgi:hypothetical protein
VEGGRKRVLRFLKDNFYGTGEVVIHHVDVRIIEGVDAEIHFMPGYARNPFLHRKLQRFFSAHADEQFANYNKELEFAFPTISFNAVYILSHIYMHFLYEGVGLRQIIDYYFVLKNLPEKEKERAKSDIIKLGLENFAGAVMYVIEKTLGMSDSHFVASPDMKRGMLLLDEIMDNGNFGQYDERLIHRDANKVIQYSFIALLRQMKFIRYYPMDVICIPFWKIGHWLWRMCKGYL